MNMKRLKFAEGLLEPVLLGDKLVTLRKFRAEAHMFTRGETVIGEFADFGGVLVLLEITANTEVLYGSAISNAAAKEDGFRDRAEMFTVMKTYYPDFGPDTPCAIVRFKKAK